MAQVEILSSTRARVSGRECVYFAGSNYLSLAGDSRVTEVAIRAIRKHGLSIGASRVISGNSASHIGLERRLADFCKTEDAVCFPAGYLANTAVIEALDASQTVWFVDESAHTSIQRPLAGVSTPVVRFRHCSPDDLRRQIAIASTDGCYAVALDSVFPVHGQLAPLEDMVRAVDRGRCVFVLDESHSIGVLGAGGRGICGLMDLHDVEILHTGSLAKAFGVHGGFVAGRKERVESIRRAASAYPGATPLPQALCEAAEEAIRLVQSCPEILEALGRNVSRMRTQLSDSGLPMPAPGIPIFTASFEDPAAAHRKCLEEGIYVPLFSGYPGCPPGGILRWTIQVDHTTAEIDHLARCFAHVIRAQLAKV
jgi:7-keto-8-aminopelargonate synthetase-like enzyme